MKIIFVCGSIEPGRDGVGDYTRRLAVKLTQLGHSISIIGLYDSFTETVLNEMQFINEIGIEVLRIPYGFNNFYRVVVTRRKVEEFDPDWVSLQFVIFAFQKKGLPFKLISQLKELFTGFKVHIMFHELWVGLEKGSSLKVYLWGKVQKKIIQRMFRCLKPELIHTHTKLYQAQLVEMGHNAKYLPIFSNISFINKRDMKISNKSELNFTVFGLIHPEPRSKLFIKEVVKYGIENNKSIKFTFIGNNGKYLTNWLSILDKEEVVYEIKGPQSVLEISILLKDSDFGVSTTELYKIEKSGSVAAFLEHGIPVINIATSMQYRIKFNKELGLGIFEYKQGFLSEILKEDIQLNIDDKIETTSSIFYTDLMNFYLDKNKKSYERN